MNAITIVNEYVNDFFSRRLQKVFPGAYATAKHNHFKDFGFPETVTFELAYNMWRRNGIARAAINKTIGKVWSEFPFLLEHERDGRSHQREEHEGDGVAGQVVPRPERLRELAEARWRRL